MEPAGQYKAPPWSKLHFFLIASRQALSEFERENVS
jgi:hypothetical protein